ncbi:hypothetical protein HDU99_002555 [Rhizoclosmatium hyalinum]|nr:hypothetical protein HDU99_002555 [Rhizoclosmatium hyalinum]
MKAVIGSSLIAIIGALGVIIAVVFLIPEVGNFRNSAAREVAFGEFTYFKINISTLFSLISTVESSLLTVAGGLLLNRWAWCAFSKSKATFPPLSSLDIPAKNMMQALYTIWYNPASSSTALALIMFFVIALSSVERIVLSSFVSTSNDTSANVDTFYGQETFMYTDTNIILEPFLPLISSDQSATSLTLSSQSLAVKILGEMTDSGRNSVCRLQNDIWTCQAPGDEVAPLISCSFYDCTTSFTDYADFKMTFNTPTKTIMRQNWLESTITLDTNLGTILWSINRVNNRTRFNPYSNNTGTRFDCTFTLAKSKRVESFKSGMLRKTFIETYQPKIGLNFNQRELPIQVVGFLYLSLQNLFNGTCLGLPESGADPLYCTKMFGSLPQIISPEIENTDGMRAEMNYVVERLLRHLKANAMPMNQTVTCTDCVKKPILAVQNGKLRTLFIFVFVVNGIVIIMAIAAIIFAKVGGMDESVTVASVLQFLGRDVNIVKHTEKIVTDKNLQYVRIGKADATMPFSNENWVKGL